ncbi:MAG: hypothetical protein ACYSW4_04935 [Planctomycetota bacterium]|jgi:hypothetical protein
MSLTEINWHPNHQELRNLGKIALCASALISLLLYVLKGLGIQWAIVIVALGITIFLASMISLKLTRMIYLALILITMPIGLVVSFILMATFYFLLLTPLGLFFRLIGRDPLYRKFEGSAKSYWLTHKSHSTPERYFRQF